MPYRICKSFEVENGHMLSKHPDKCKFPHGHTRTVEFILEADELDHNQMVCDFKVVKDVIRDFVMTFDHAMCINTNDPQYAFFKKTYGDRVIGFPKQDPTTEVLAKTFHDELKKALGVYAAGTHAEYQLSPKVRIARVRVWETSSSWAEYQE